MAARYKFLFALLIVAGVALAAKILFGGKGSGGELTLYGNVDIRQVELSFRVFGKLTTVLYEEGDLIKKGELLAELDPEPYAEKLRELQAKSAALLETLAYNDLQLKRREALVGDKSVSEENYQQSYFDQKSMAFSVEGAAAAAAGAMIQLDDTQLTAPSDGIIYTRIREPGTILAPGEPVYSMALNAPIWVRAYISEPNLGRIFPGMRGEVHTDTPENPIYQGHIGFISPIAEFTPKNVETSDLRTNLVYQLRLIIDNPDKGLRQGMPVTVKLFDK